MADSKAFLNIPRQEAGYRPVHERITDFSQVEQTLNSHERKLQASRCMDCGVPFCHWACPLGNKQPEFQDALYKHTKYSPPQTTSPNLPDASVRHFAKSRVY